LATASFKSGGFFYIGKETNQVLIGHDHSEPATSRNEAALVPCRSMSKVSQERRRFCMSLIDPERPGWYMTHRDGYLYFEPEYAPRNPDTFDDDASFFVTRSQLFPGFRTMESISLPNHFVHSTADDKVALSFMQNTPEFHTSASLYAMQLNYKGESTVIHSFLL